MFGLLVLLLNIPMCIRAISALVNPLQVDPSGARFAGRYRRWQVNTITGRVAGANTYTTTSTRTTYTTVTAAGAYRYRATSTTRFCWWTRQASSTA